MGISANQARFLSLTSRQVDLEYRMQQICHRRIRLASELENIATDYNNKMSNRELFASDSTMYETLTAKNLEQLGYKVIETENNDFAGRLGTMNNMIPGTSTNTSYTAINSKEAFMELINGDGTGDINLNGNYILNCNIDLEGETLGKSVIDGIFTGNFDGNGYAIQNMNLTESSGGDNVGFFSELNGAVVSNLVIDNASITVANSSVGVGAIAGKMTGGTLTNSSVSEVSISAGNNCGSIGGALGQASTNATISNMAVSGDIDSGSTSNFVGGAIGYLDHDGNVSKSYSNVDLDVDNGACIGGFIGSVKYGNMSVSESYSNGDVKINSGQNSGADILNYGIGGFIGQSHATSGDSFAFANNYTESDIIFDSSVIARKVAGFSAVQVDTGGSIAITNSYANNDLPPNSQAYGATSVHAIADANVANNTNFYNSSYGATNATSAVGLSESQIADGASPIDGWSSAVWNKSGTSPTLSNANEPDRIVDDLEEGLRSGTYALVRDADNFTQEPIELDDGLEYEKVDWRTVADIDDDLDNSDDVDTEAEYENAIEKINAQDKKLQLEQSQIEVEHKAIVTQKDSVKSIIDKNTEKSFKSFT